MAPIPYPVYYGALVGAAIRDVQTPILAGSNEVAVMVAVVDVIG